MFAVNCGLAHLVLACWHFLWRTKHKEERLDHLINSCLGPSLTSPPCSGSGRVHDQNQLAQVRCWRHRPGLRPVHQQEGEPRWELSNRPVNDISRNFQNFLRRPWLGLAKILKLFILWTSHPLLKLTKIMFPLSTSCHHTLLMCSNDNFTWEPMVGSQVS